MTADPLLRWRAEFPIVETCTYLVSHSLGAMPRRTAGYLQEFADTWSRRGVRAWADPGDAAGVPGEGGVRDRVARDRVEQADVGEERHRFLVRSSAFRRSSVVPKTA